MPISENGNPYYTQKQYHLARYASSALAYAQAQGYELVRDGLYYHLKEHDSMIFTPNGAWYWNSQGVSGGAIEFQIYYEGKTLIEAVLTLAGEHVTQQGMTPSVHPLGREEKTASTTKEPFVLPQKSASSRQVYAYLCKTRGLDQDVVKTMMEQGILYESVTRKKDGSGEIHNACFVTKNYETGVPCGAFQRGLNSFGTPFKREVAGSSKQYGWLLKGSSLTPETVYVFEAAIDAASFVSLNYMAGRRERPYDCLALGGLSITGLENYLKANPGIRNICLALDADEPGQNASARFDAALKGRGYTLCDMTALNLAGRCKDWNELLVQQRQAEQQIESHTASAQPEP